MGPFFPHFHTLLTFDPLPLHCVLLEINESHLRGLLVTMWGLQCGEGGGRIGTRRVSVNRSEGSDGGGGVYDWQSQRFNAASIRTLADGTRFFSNAERKKQVSDSAEKGRRSHDGGSADKEVMT